MFLPQISSISESIADCPRLKVLRLEENCLQIAALTPKILEESSVSLLAMEGNLFDMKQLHDAPGYEKVSLEFVLHRCTGINCSDIA